MTRTAHRAAMLAAPLHERLQALVAARRTGCSFAPLFAELSREGQITLRTDRGPVYLWLHNLESAAAGAAERARAKAERNRDRWRMQYAATVAPIPAPMAKPAPVAKAKAAKPEPLPAWSAHRIPVGKAPKRAVGNFTTPELRQRTIDELRANLATAQASGCNALAKVMAEALAVAVARPVDNCCAQTGTVTIPKRVK